jgi:hypothetical protein
MAQMLYFAGQAATRHGLKNYKIWLDWARLALMGEVRFKVVSCSWKVSCVNLPRKDAKGPARPAATKGNEPRISQISRIKNSQVGRLAEPSGP